jgi:exosortase/archaeosortase family protein
VIPASGTLVRVTRECDAFGFFSLIAAISIVHIVSRYQAQAVFKCLAVAGALVGAYLLTIFLNGVRIVGAYYVHEWAQAFHLEKFQSLLHLGIGVMVFLPVLFAVLTFWEKELFYGRSSK